MKIIRRVILAVLIIVMAALYAYGTWERPIYDTNMDPGSYLMTPQLQKEMKQTFLCPENGLHGLSVKLNFANQESIDGYTWELQDESGTVVAQGQFNNEMLLQSSYSKKQIINFEFDQLTDSKDKVYAFVIQNGDSNTKNPLLGYSTAGSKYAKDLTVDGELLPQTLIIKQEIKMFNVETFLVFVGVMLYVVFFIKFMYKLFR